MKEKEGKTFHMPAPASHHQKEKKTGWDRASVPSLVKEQEEGRRPTKMREDEKLRESEKESAASEKRVLPLTSFTEHRG